MNTYESNQDAERVKSTPSDAVAEPQRSLSQTPEEAKEERRRRCQERIDDHLDSVLASPDNLDACMGWMLCDVMDECNKMKLALDKASVNRESPLAGIKESMPLRECYLKLARQAERFANVTCRIRESGATSAQGSTSRGRQRNKTY